MLKVWIDADEMIDAIVVLSAEIHGKVLANVPREQMVDVLDRVDALNSELTDTEAQFSNFLGEGSRWLQNLLMTALTLLVLGIETTGLALTLSLSRSLTRRLRASTQAWVLRTTKKVCYLKLSARSIARFPDVMKARGLDSFCLDI